MKTDKLLNQAISECKAFLDECKAYNNRINESWKGYGDFIHFNSANIERGTLKARSLLLIRKLQAWRKCGKVK